MRLIFFFILLWASIVRSASNHKPDSETAKSLGNRQKQEKVTEKLSHSFSIHKPFYILPLSYSFSPNRNALNGISEVDNLEVKFQFSFKFNIIDSFFSDHLKLSFAYTNLSFWQLYNGSNSSPFRETNHEPDVFLDYNPGGQQQSVIDNIFRVGFVHQSNGLNVPLSRSWNRLYMQGIFNVSFAIASLKVWHRIKEDPKTTPASSGGDDNPNILAYMGHFELNLIKKMNEHTLSLLLRNNLRKENRGAVEASWSFPLSENFRGYTQYFNGYGESLIDYNSPIQRLGIGLLVGDWI